MSSRQKTQQLIVEERENLNSKRTEHGVKESSVKLLSHRPALGEVGNKIHIVQQDKNGFNKGDGSRVKAKTKVCNKPQITLQKSTVTKSHTSNLLKSLNPEIQLKGQQNFLKQSFKETVRPQQLESYSCTRFIDIEDVDSADKSDPLLLPYYAQEIFTYLYQLENKYYVCENFLNSHRSTPNMRSVLVNWMVEVCVNFKFLQETLHLSVAIVDHYLNEKNNVGRETLQLVGTSAMFLASKYEEIQVPGLSDFVYICDDTYTDKEIMKMEVDIFKTVGFCLGRPLAIHFLRRFSKIAKVRVEHHILAKYLIDLALNEYTMSHLKPSIKAAAACCLAISILTEATNPAKVWTHTLAHYSTYTYSDIKSVLIKYAYILVKIKTSKFQAVRQKYSSAVYNKISTNPKLKSPVIDNLLALKNPLL